MSHFFSLLSLEHLISEVQRILRRFPLSVAFVLVVSAIFTYMHMDNYALDEGISQILRNIIITSILSFCLSTALTLLIEKMRVRPVFQMLSALWVLGFALIFYFSIGNNPFDSNEGMTLIFLTFFWFFVFLFFAPFISILNTKQYKESSYVKYFYAMATVLLMSIIIGSLIMILGSIALWSIDTLFDITWIGQRGYGYWTIIAYSLTAPLFWLMRIPTIADIEGEKGSENAFFIFLVKYVGLPFISIYFCILYAYSVKVLSNYSDWPKWQISWLVIGFSTFGYILYIFSGAFSSAGGLVARIRQAFPYAVLPQIFMLFYAIYLRIAQYDLTMNRYFVVVFGIWLTGISLYYSFSKTKKLAIIPASLAIITFVISFGPWSVYHLPFDRQYQKLVSNLTTARILSGSVIVPLKKYESIDEELSGEIYGEIVYVCGFDTCHTIRKLFAKELEKAQRDRLTAWEKSEPPYQKCLIVKKEGCYREVYSKELSSWEIQDILTKTIKVRPIPYRGATPPEIVSFSLGSNDSISTIDRPVSIFPIDTRGYDMIVPLSSLWDNNANRVASLQLDTKMRKGQLVLNGEVLDAFSLDDLETSLLALRGQSRDANFSLTRDQMTFNLSGKVYTVKGYLQNINIPNPDYHPIVSSENTYYGYADGYALLHKK